MNWNTASNDFLTELKEKGENISNERFVNLYAALIEEARKVAPNLPYEQVDNNTGLFYTYTPRYIELTLTPAVPSPYTVGIPLVGLAKKMFSSKPPSLSYDVIEVGNRSKTVELEINWESRHSDLDTFFLGWIEDIKQLQDYYKSTKPYLNIKHNEELSERWIEWMRNLDDALIAGTDIHELVKLGLNILTSDIENISPSITTQKVKSNDTEVQVSVNGKQILDISLGGHTPEPDQYLQVGGWYDTKGNFEDAYIDPRKGRQNLDEFYTDIFTKVNEHYEQFETHENKLLSLENKLLSLNPYLPAQLQTDDPETMFELLKQMIIAGFTIRKVIS